MELVALLRAGNVVIVNEATTIEVFLIGSLSSSFSSRVERAASWTARRHLRGSGTVGECRRGETWAGWTCVASQIDLAARVGRP